MPPDVIKQLRGEHIKLKHHLLFQLTQRITPIVEISTVVQMALRSDGLVKRYKKRTVVNEVSMQVQQGEIVGLLGPNGAGKTTTFYMIVGMIRPNAGRVFLDNTEITKMPMYQRARMGIGYLPQEAICVSTVISAG